MINGKYHTERICKGEKIVIDIAEICGRYEIAVLAKGGTELEMQTVRTTTKHAKNFLILLSDWTHGQLNKSVQIIHKLAYIFSNNNWLTLYIS